MKALRFIGRHVRNFVGMVAFSATLFALVITLSTQLGNTSAVIDMLKTVSTTSTILWWIDAVLLVCVYIMVTSWCVREPVARAEARLMEKVNEVREELALEKMGYEREARSHKETLDELDALEEKLEALEQAQALPATAEQAVEKMTQLLDGWVDRMGYASNALASAKGTVEEASTALQTRVAGVQDLLAQIEERARTVVGALDDEEPAKTTLMATAPDVASVSIQLSEDDRSDVAGLLKVMKRMRDHGDLEVREDTLVEVFEWMAKLYRSQEISVEQYLAVLWVLGTTMVHCATNLEEEGRELIVLVEGYLPAFAEVDL